MSGKDNLVVVSSELKLIVLKVSITLSKESLKRSLVSFVRAGLVYLVSLSLLNYVKTVDFLLESSDLVNELLGVNSALGMSSVGGGRSLRRHRILLLFSR